MTSAGSTEPLGLGAVLRCTLAVACVALFYTGIDTYALLAWSGPAPVTWVFGFVAAATALVVLHPGRPTPLLRSPLLLWTCLYFVSTTLWAVASDQSPAILQVLIDRYRSIALLVALMVVFDDPRARRLGVYVVALAVVVASCVNVAELMEWVTFSEATRGLMRVGGRSGGFYINPNDSGMAIVFGLAITLVALPRLVRFPLLVVGTLGVGVTFSRGATLCLAALVLWLLATRAIPAWLLLACILSFHFGRALDSLDSSGLLNENTSARVHLEKDDSGRGGIARKALDLFVEHPFAGKGLGATRVWDASVSSHNTYLNLAGDQGMVGLLTLPALLVALVATRRRAIALAITLLIAGVFTDGLLEQQRFTLLLLALATAADASERAPKTEGLDDGDPAGRGPAPGEDLVDPQLQGAAP
jgi:hypothetical protein